MVGQNEVSDVTAILFKASVQNSDSRNCDKS